MEGNSYVLAGWALGGRVHLQCIFIVCSAKYSCMLCTINAVPVCDMTPVSAMSHAPRSHCCLCNLPLQLLHPTCRCCSVHEPVTAPSQLLVCFATASALLSHHVFIFNHPYCSSAASLLLMFLSFALLLGSTAPGPACTESNADRR